MIIVKEDVVEEVFEYINEKMLLIDNVCFVWEGVFCLLDEEKIEILEFYFKFVKELKNLDNLCVKFLFND